jgi:hypothetical protein
MKSQKGQVQIKGLRGALLNAIRKREPLHKLLVRCYILQIAIQEEKQLSLVSSVSFRGYCILVQQYKSDSQIEQVRAFILRDNPVQNFVAPLDGSIFDKQRHKPRRNKRSQVNIIFLKECEEMRRMITQQHRTKMQRRFKMRQFALVLYEFLMQNIREVFSHEGVEVSIALFQGEIIISKQQEWSNQFQESLLIFNVIRLAIAVGQQTEIVPCAIALEIRHVIAGPVDVLVYETSVALREVFVPFLEGDRVF